MLKAGLAIVGSLLVAFVGLAIWGAEAGEDRAADTASRDGLISGPVGTSGTDEPEGAGDDSGPPAAVPPAIIQELETITGAVDGHELVGRRVDLHVTVADIANDVAFWIGENDNRVLVVIDRDNRNGAKRQAGAPPSHGILTVHRGQQAAISGTVQRRPKAEEMHSWGLTNDERARLSDRPIYVRADTVTANGHAGH
jgi:hypothetical protein